MTGTRKVFLFWLGWWVGDAVNTALDIAHPIPIGTTRLALATFGAALFFLLYVVSRRDGEDARG